MCIDEVKHIISRELGVSHGHPGAECQNWREREASSLHVGVGTLLHMEHHCARHLCLSLHSNFRLSGVFLFLRRENREAMTREALQHCPSEERE